MKSFVDGLNPEQRKAVETVTGPVLVLAGAGTGKTRVITHRIAHMLHKGIKPESILAMTFTKRAAGEMKQRVGHLLPKGGAQGVTIGTFHSFCAVSLRQMYDRVGLRRDFGICDEDDQLSAMKQALRDLQIPESTIQPRACLSRISLLKNKLVGWDTLVESDDDWEAMIGRAYRRYETALKTCGVVDFDDLLTYTVRLLDAEKTLRQFQDRYRYLLVDEYQDTNGPQYEIVRRIGAKHRNVCVVGDDDQSIYSWRGADSTKILNFDKDFPDATVIRLETNYRSTPQILTGANQVIRNNAIRHAKSLRPATRDGEEIVIRKLKDEDEEALYVVEDLAQRIRDTKAPFRDFAILYRTAVQSRLFEMQLRQRAIPYHLVGGMSFFDRKEVKDILAYLRVVANPGDELSLLRIINTPPRGIGSTAVENMMNAAAEQRKPLKDVILGGAEPGVQPAAMQAARDLVTILAGLGRLRDGKNLVALIRQLIPAVKYGDEITRCYPDPATRTKRWEAVNEVMNMAESHVRHRKDASLVTFLEDVTLNADDAGDDKEAKGDKMTLMTLHSAKGLEFQNVYLVGVEEGLLPHSRSLQEGTLDEERRLAYVGITRARARLVMSFAESRANRGQRATVRPSRFLYEMRGKPVPDEVLGSAVAAGGAPAVKPVSAEKKPAKKDRRTEGGPRSRGRWAEVARQAGR